MSNIPFLKQQTSNSYPQSQVHSEKNAQSDLENFATKAQNLELNLANLVQNGQSFIFGARHFIFASDGT